MKSSAYIILFVHVLVGIKSKNFCYIVPDIAPEMDAGSFYMVPNTDQHGIPKYMFFWKVIETDKLSLY